MPVLLCAPFGWEEVCSYRSRRELAIALAARGHLTLRLELPGTGDSPGGDRQQGFEPWRAAVSEAADWLRAREAVERVAAVGMGVGGLLACAALGEGAPIDDLVLWNTPASGGVLVRELRAFARLERSQLGVSDGELAIEPDAVEAGGFWLGAATAHALQAFQVDSLPEQIAPGRALLLARDGLSVDERLRGALARRGVEVTTAPGLGYGEMTAEPQLARPPRAEFDRILDWLEEEPTTMEAAHTPLAAVAGSGFVEDQLTEVELDEAAVREVPMYFELPSNRLFGILSEPTGGSVQPIVAVLLNAGAIRRIGPNRMWVEIARRWAEMGVCTLRLDLESIGDSDGDLERFNDLGELYAADLASQVSGTLDVLSGRVGVARFVLAGLCSGAYWSFHTAILDDRVRAALMLNPQTLFWDPSNAAARDVRKALAQPSSWTRLLKGQADPARIVELARELPSAARGVAQRAGSRLERRPDTQAELLQRALQALEDKGKRAFLAFSREEPLYEEMRRDGRLDELRRHPSVELASLAGSDHTLRPRAARHDAHRELDRALSRELERLGASMPDGSHQAGP